MVEDEWAYSILAPHTLGKNALSCKNPSYLDKYIVLALLGVVIEDDRRGFWELNVQYHATAALARKSVLPGD